MTASWKTRAVAAGLFVMTMAPAAGNIGSCGQEAVLLDPEKFFASKQGLDCERCTECPVITNACERACAGQGAPTAFPEYCAPLVHDGEVCLDALNAASCGDYESYMADEGATIPTECDFCPVDENGEAKRGDP